MIRWKFMVGGSMHNRRAKDLMESLSIVNSLAMLTEDIGESALVRTFVDFIDIVGDEVSWALGGGLALGFRSRPRATLDIDIFLLSEDDADKVKTLLSKKFNLERGFRVVHKDTGVTLDLLTAETLGFDDEIATLAIDRAIVEKILGRSIKVMSSDGLVALKLQRGRFKDQGDIESLLEANGKIDISMYPLKDHQVKLYNDIVSKTL
jgi:hypothetical protein